MIEELIKVLTQYNSELREIALNNLHWVLEHEPHPKLHPQYEDLSKAYYVAYRALKLYDSRHEIKK